MGNRFERRAIAVKKHLTSGIMTAAALAAALLLLQGPADSQDPAGGKAPGDAKAPGKGAFKGKGKGKARPTGPTPRMADGKVDFSGLWNGGGPVGDVGQGLMPGEEISLTPWSEKIMDARQSKDDPEANCLPTGIPRIAPYPWRVLQTATHVFYLFEGNIHSFRQIFIDGRKHPADLDPTWYGDSIGSWDGDTLVVDTIGFNDKFWFDFRGHPHSEQLHTIERLTRPDLGTLDIETQIIDPTAYTKPFKIKFTATLRLGEELMEYICQENQQDAIHLQGPAGLP
jgi:hypothetical protein